MCVKCIIDGDRLRAVSTLMANQVEGWKETVAALFDQTTGIELSDDEHRAIIATSDEWCSYADEMIERAYKWDYRLRGIAKAHSYPNLPTKVAE